MNLTKENKSHLSKITKTSSSACACPIHSMSINLRSFINFSLSAGGTEKPIFEHAQSRDNFRVIFGNYVMVFYNWGMGEAF